MSDVLAVIPARGGSLELRRKNLLPITGTPMFLRSAQAARDAGCQVVVSTDDPEIRSTAVVAGFEVHDRGPELADCPVDEVVKAAAEGWDGAVLLVQPTVQPITADILGAFLSQAQMVPMMLFRSFRHNLWVKGEWAADRANRQDIKNPPLLELGIRWWPTVDRIGDPQVNIVTSEPLVDVDTAADYRATTIPKTVALWPLADDKHGMGHLRRCLAIAERLQHHDVRWIDNDLDDAAQTILTDRGWSADRFGPCIETHPDLWILDRLDNHNLRHLPGKTVTLEDPSTYPADLKIDALYKPSLVGGGGSYKSGVDWCVLRPEFLAGDYQIREHINRIMILFGGTDPSRLGERINQLTFYAGVDRVDWVKPGEDRPVAEAMHQADILITSAGRTVYEAAAVGIPTVVLAQNLRETTHAHLGFEHGNIYLGLGKLVTDKMIVDTIDTLSYNRDLRQELSERGRPDGLGLDRIVHAVEGLLGGL